MLPNQEWTHKLGTCPAWVSNPQPFSVQNNPPTGSHSARVRPISCRESYNGSISNTGRGSDTELTKSRRCPLPLLLRDIYPSQERASPSDTCSSASPYACQHHTTLSNQLTYPFLVLFHQTDDVCSPEITNPINLAWT